MGEKTFQEIILENMAIHIEENVPQLLICATHKST